MGGVCPCFAGAEKAVAAPPAKAAAAPKTAAPPTSEETKPLLEPATLPPKDSAPAAPAAAPPATQDAPTEQASGLGGIEIGSCVEVYSNSYKAWCPGVVYALDKESIFVAYQVPGEPADANISTKTLPVDTNELKTPEETGAWLTASVEVYSHSNKAWCLGKVTEINKGILSVVFFYPNEPPDAVPVMKQLPLGDRDLRLRGIDAAFGQSTVGGGAGHELLQVNDKVEVYSNSLGVWCPGTVQELKEGVATIGFFYPDMDPNNEPPAVKELPLGHQDLRVPGAESRNTGPPVQASDLSVGMQIEVYSVSRELWIVSTVQEITDDGMVTVQLRYPDMPADSDLYEKVLPVGHQDMRLLPKDK